MENRVKNRNIYMIIETTDATGRYIIAVLVGILNKDENKKPWLFELTEVPSTNHIGITQTINSVVNQLSITLYPIIH